MPAVLAEYEPNTPSNVTVALHGDATVTLRPMRATDADGLVRFHSTLSTHTTYMRFFSVHPRLSDKEIERFTHVDHRIREAVVAIADGEIVGVGRFDRSADAPEAEMAFVVSDKWQGLGVGSALLQWLVDRAPQVGVSKLVAVTLPSNRAMLTVFRHSGLPVTVTYGDDVAHVAIDLTGDGAEQTLAET